MKTLLSIAITTFALALPLAAEAGEGCSHAKEATTASVEGGEAVAHGTCAEACTQAAKAGATCGCGHAAKAPVAETAAVADHTPLPEVATPGN